jgi:tetratricopeptide (TPR) repeat protein
MRRRESTMTRSSQSRISLVLVLMLGALHPVGARADTQSDCQWTINDPDRVVSACTTLLAGRKTPEAWMHFNRGLAFKVLGQLEAAERDYSSAIALDARNAAAYTNRGNVRLLLNNTKGALADYRKAIRLDPKDTVARQNLQAIEAALRKVGADKTGQGVTSGTAR